MTEIEKLKKEIEDLKLIIESKIIRLNLKISTLNAWENYLKYKKRTIPIATEGAECARTDTI